MSSLRSFTSALDYKPLTDAWVTGTELLLKESPLEIFQSYVNVSDEALADTLCARIVDHHRDHLVRFSFHQQWISIDSVEHVCTSCPRLEELFVTVKFTEMVFLLSPFLFFVNLFTEGLIRRTLYRSLPR